MQTTWKCSCFGEWYHWVTWWWWMELMWGFGHVFLSGEPFHCTSAKNMDSLLISVGYVTKKRKIYVSWRMPYRGLVVLVENWNSSKNLFFKGLPGVKPWKLPARDSDSRNTMYRPSGMTELSRSWSFWTNLDRFGVCLCSICTSSTCGLFSSDPKIDLQN